MADIDATLARAVELGGVVIMPKFSPGPNATLALVADPEGHVVGLTELVDTGGSRPPATEPPEPTPGFPHPERPEGPWDGPHGT